MPSPRVRDALARLRAAGLLAHAVAVACGGAPPPDDATGASIFARLQKYREEPDDSVGFGDDASFVARELEAARGLVERVGALR